MEGSQCLSCCLNIFNQGQARNGTPGRVHSAVWLVPQEQQRQRLLPKLQIPVLSARHRLLSGTSRKDPAGQFLPMSIQLSKDKFKLCRGEVGTTGQAGAARDLQLAGSALAFFSGPYFA